MLASPFGELVAYALGAEQGRTAPARRREAGDCIARATELVTAGK
jgi:hypothetical protein